MGGEDGKRERQKEYGKARALESWRGHKSVWERGREACPGIQAGKHCASRSKHSTELSASCPKSYGRHHRAARKAERVRETSRARPRRLDGLAPAPRPLPRPAACGRKRGGSRPCLPDPPPLRTRCRRSSSLPDRRGALTARWRNRDDVRRLRPCGPRQPGEALRHQEGRCPTVRPEMAMQIQ